MFNFAFFKKKKKISQKKYGKRLRMFYFFLFALFLLLFPSPNNYFKTVPKTYGINIFKEYDLPTPPLIPQNKNLSDPPIVSAHGVVIKDIPSGMILFAKNDKVRLSPASTTKIMTALVALDFYNLDDVLTVKKIINSGRVMGLVPGEKITVEALLYGILVHSANDAAYVLADNYPGGVDAFVEAMNKKAYELNLSDTHFANPIGFDDEMQYTTASDLAKQSLFALHNKTFAKIVGIKAITVSDINFSIFHDLKNVNELLGKVAGVSGVKTGFTQNAGEILVSEVKRDGKTLLFVVLKSKDRFGETEALINWVFTNFQWVPVDNIISLIEKQ